MASKASRQAFFSASHCMFEFQEKRRDASRFAEIGIVDHGFRQGRSPERPRGLQFIGKGQKAGKIARFTFGRPSAR